MTHGGIDLRHEINKVVGFARGATKKGEFPVWVYLLQKIGTSLMGQERNKGCDMNTAAQALRDKLVSIHGGFHGVVSHDIPAFVWKAPLFSSQITSRG